MAVRKIATVNIWIGLSSDTKPTSVPIGSKFYEYDTKVTYITYDGTSWESLPSVQAILNEVDTFIIADRDEFDVADADANNERWTPGYITGTEGGSSVIASGKLTVTVNPDASPTEARYAVLHMLPLYADFFTVIADLNCTWGTMGTTGCAAGMIISAGTTYDSQNYFALERTKTSAANQFTLAGKLNNVAISAVTPVTTTDDVVALKVERWDNVWRFYYSTTQYPNYIWTLLAEREDSSVYMTDQVVCYLESYSKGSADAESIIADFDNFKYYVGAGGGGQYIAGDYSSAWVSADVDGNLFERQEAMQAALSINAASGGEFEADGVPDLWDALVVDSSTDANITGMTGNRDGAVVERLAAISNAVGITNAATLTGYEEDGTGANLFKTLVAVQSVTTGAGTTTTITDTARTEGADYWNDNLVAILSGSAIGQVTSIVDDDGAGTLTLRPALTAAPGTSVVYAILKNFTPPVPAANTTDNYQPRDVIGNKTDDADYTDNTTTTSIIALLKGVLGVSVIAEGDGFTTSSATIPADTDRTEGNDFFNGCWLMPVAGGCAFQPRLIVDYTTTTDIFTLDPEQPFTTAPGDVAYVILSPNSQLVPATNGTNNFTPAHVLGNKADTSVTGAVTTTDTMVGYVKQLVTNTYRLDETACGDVSDPVDMTTEVADNTVLANILSKTGDTSTYDRRYDSLEMASDKLGAFTGDEGPDQGDSVKANLDLIQTDIGDPSASSDTLYTQVRHINKFPIDVTTAPVANTLADTLHKDINYTYSKATDSLEAISDRIGATDATAAATGVVNAKLNGIIAALEIGAAGSGKFEVDGAEGLWTQLKEIPASDGAVVWNDTARAAIQTEANDALIANNLDHAALTACGDVTDPVDMSTEVADNTVLANILDDGGDTSSYDRRYHSLVAIANTLNSATGIFHEQADTPLTYNTDETEDTVLSLATADTRYLLRSLWLKFADPGANTITVRLKLLINDVSTTVDTFSVTTSNFGTYFSLMDMFGQSQIVGDSIIITTQNSAAASVAVTGQYSYAKNNV